MFTSGAIPWELAVAAAIGISPSFSGGHPAEAGRSANRLSSSINGTGDGHGRRQTEPGDCRLRAS